MVSNLRSRKTTGPLNERQWIILRELADGQTHAAIAKKLDVTRTCVSENTSVLVAKLGVANTPEAIKRYAMYQAYMRAAQLLISNTIAYPSKDGEDHVNHILSGLAEELRKRAKRMMPA